MTNKITETIQEGRKELNENFNFAYPFSDSGIECKRQLQVFLSSFSSKLLEAVAEEVEKLKRTAFRETNTYSEVQQENAWYNDGVKDTLALFRVKK